MQTIWVSSDAASRPVKCKMGVWGGDTGGETVSCIGTVPRGGPLTVPMGFYRAGRRCSRPRGVNFACGAASDRFICDSACMKDVLSNALRLA